MLQKTLNTESWGDLKDIMNNQLRIDGNTYQQIAIIMKWQYNLRRLNQLHPNEIKGQMSCDICDSSLDKQTYTNQTKILQSEGFKVFYPWNQLQGK